jgi:hypothetical protein
MGLVAADVSIEALDVDQVGVLLEDFMEGRRTEVLSEELSVVRRRRMAEEKGCAQEKLLEIKAAHDAKGEGLAEEMFEQMRVQRLRLQERLRAKKGPGPGRHTDADADGQDTGDVASASARLEQAFDGISSMLRQADAKELTEV